MDTNVVEAFAAANACVDARRGEHRYTEDTEIKSATDSHGFTRMARNLRLV
jgi:hypothetical protein